MSTTFYSPTYTVNPSGSNPMKIRAKCVYDTSTSNTSVTISGTIALQHTGGTVSLTSTEAAKVGIYGLSTAPTSSTSTYIDGVYYSGNCSPYKKTSDIVKNSISAHSSWTDLTSTSFSFSVTRGTSTKTSYLFAGLHFSVQEMPGFITSAAYKSISIPALTSYNVTYNANGGSGAPATQKKYYGQTLTLSSTKPTRTNYVFKNWNTASGGTGTTYNPGASYTGNAALTLYAQWYAPYTVTYNANGGSGAPASQTKVYNTNLTLSTTKPTRSNCDFLNWNTAANGSGTAYNPGATYSTNANLSLYAIWVPKPQITALTAVRCDSNGDDDDEGEYCRVECTWAFDTTVNSNVSSGTLTGTITPQGGSATSFTFESGSATTGGGGNATAIVPNLDTDQQYTVTVTVTSGSSTYLRTTSRSVILTRAFFIMDFKAGGTGLGIGRAAPASGLEIGFKTTFDDDITTYGNAFVKDHSVYLDNQDLDVSYNATLSAQKEGSTIIRGKNSEHLAAFRGRQLTTGEKRAIMESHGYDSNGNSIWCYLFCQVDKSGTRSYSVSDQSAFRTAIDVPISSSGGTVTSNIAICNGGMDRDGSNPSSEQWSAGFRVLDKDSEPLAQIGATRGTDGKTGAYLYAYNEKSDGTQVANNLRLFVAKDGTLSVSVSTPSGWRTALDAAQASAINLYSTGTGSSSDVSMANDTSVNLGTYTFSTAGYYIIFAYFRFAANATGFRQGIISTTSAENAAPADRSVMVQAANGWQTLISIAYPVNVTSSTKYYFVGKQKSGGALTGNVLWRIVRLK